MTFAAFLGEALIGWLIADLVTGTFHWWEDRLGREDMPFLGQWLIAPNRLHHREPLAFTEGSFLDRSLASMVAAAAVSVLWLALLGPSVTWAAATVGGLVVTEVHRLAHQPKSAWGLVRVMQETGLIQSPKHHAGHHRPPSDRRYCVLTDWLNPTLDALNLWGRLETALGRRGA